MGIVLFDQKTTSSTKKVINNSFSINCLFDCYLTELTSYQQLTIRAYLTKKQLHKKKNNINNLHSVFYSFDGYLTEQTSYRQLSFLTKR